eukprot:6994884-Alexandrium_andersonii.AAC.1
MEALQADHTGVSKRVLASVIPVLMHARSVGSQCLHGGKGLATIAHERTNLLRRHGDMWIGLGLHLLGNEGVMIPVD